MTRYLDTDEQRDVLISLREVRHQIARADHDIHSWKWATIALASAVNGALTCSLTGTQGVGALDTRTAEKTIAAQQMDATEPRPQPRLASPACLLRRARGIGRIEEAGEPIVVSLTHIRSFQRLFDFRSEFLHFKPTSWSIEISGMPAIFWDVMRIVRATIDDGWAFRHLEAPDREDLRSQCDAILTALAPADPP